MTKPIPIQKSSSFTERFMARISRLPWVYRLSIGGKITLGFILLLLVTLITSGLGYFAGMQISQMMNDMNNRRIPLILTLTANQNYLLHMELNLQHYLTVADDTIQTEYNANNEAFTNNLTQLKAISHQLDSADQVRLGDLEKNFITWSELPPKIFALPPNKIDAETIQTFNTKALPLSQAMETLLVELIEHQQELLQTDFTKQQTAIRNTQLYLIGSGGVSFLLMLLLAALTRFNIAGPIRRLKEAAIELGKGDLTVKAPLEFGDETGELAQAINTMTDRLRGLIDTLEERVQIRTRALQTSAEISRQITSILNQDDLLEYIVNRIQTEFDFYHVQVYLVQEQTGDLLMVKGSGKVGQELEAKKHRLHEGQGIVGTVAFLNEQFLSNDVDEVINFVRNKLLPKTESELALPLRKGDKVLGVLDIQSELKNRFSNDDVALMQSIADQIAVTIDNAGVYQDLEEALVHQYDLTLSYSRFVPREILYFLGKSSIIDVKLGDQIQQEMTVLFSDIRSFTSLSEQMTPQENFNFINDYLSRVGPIIRKHNGFIDKYIGDAVMALFSKRAEDAVDAAIAMQNSVAVFNLERSERGLPPISIAIGLHTGNVMLGTVGEAERMEGTVISDAVNLASRMEGLTKIYKASIVVSEHTLSMLGQGSNQYNVRFLDRVQVKGKKEPVSVFEILDGESERVIALKLKTRPDFETALFHYQYREFAEAKKYFEKVLAVHPEDEAAGLYMHRINYFLEYGVPVDWTGVVVLAEK